MLHCRIPAIFLLFLLAGTGCGGTAESPSAVMEVGSQSTSNAAPENLSAAANSLNPALQTADSSSGVLMAIPPGTAATAAISSGKDAAGVAAAGPGNGASQTDSTAPHDEVTDVLAEIQKLRIAPIPADLEQARQTRRQRNEQIVELATRVVRMTMKNADQQSRFQNAIEHLLEARFQMALAGTQEDIDQLYADVQALNDHDPKSAAAAEGVYMIARFSHTKAGQLGRSQPVWFETLSRWAREFADRFPEQTNRAVTLLFGAARSCELHALAATDADLTKRLMTESTLCYTTLAQKFSKTPQGQEAAAVLRRMSLPGQVLSQFSGPTLDGGFVTADEFPGKPTLIYFWESENAEFAEELLPVLQRIQDEFPPEQLRVVGVVLDEAEKSVESFLETTTLPGLQIFFPTAEQRSWNSPLVRYWGVSKVPSVWLLDSRGSVVSTTLKPADLAQTVQKLTRR